MLTPETLKKRAPPHHVIDISKFLQASQTVLSLGGIRGVFLGLQKGELLQQVGRSLAGFQTFCGDTGAPST
jgi:hypothetical protein